MSQVLQKTFQCLICKADIKLQRKTDNSGWLRFELDGSTAHKCEKKNNLMENSSATSVRRSSSHTHHQEGSDLSKEIAAIKAQLLVLVSRLDHIEKDLQKH